MARSVRKHTPPAEPLAAATPAGGDEARQFAIAAARIAAANKTEDLEILDLRELSTFADYFVLGTGTSDRQMHAVLDYIEEYGRSIGRKPYKVADPRSASWLLADYVDVVVHLFDTQYREYYDLGGLWGDAPRVAWQEDAETQAAG